MESKVYTFKCARCGKEFTAKKSNAKYCCDSCRTIGNRNKRRKNKTENDTNGNLLQIFGRLRDKNRLLELGRSTEDFCINEQDVMNNIYELILANWTPNDTRTGGTFDLACIGGKGKIKIDLITE